MCTSHTIHTFNTIHTTMHYSILFIHALKQYMILSLPDARFTTINQYHYYWARSSGMAARRARLCYYYYCHDGFLYILYV